MTRSSLWTNCHRYGFRGSPKQSLATLFHMKARMITSLTDPDAHQVQDVPEPTAKAQQAIVRVRAGGLNFTDFMTSKGGYPGTPPPPFIAGREFAGVEEASGRRVMGYMQWGAF